MFIKNIDKIILLALAIGLGSALYFAGYKSAEHRVTAEFNKLTNEQVARNVKELQVKQREIIEIESAWLNQKAEKEIVYRDRVKTVIKEVTEYVEANNLEHCTLDAERVQRINQALSKTGHTGSE